MDEKMKHKLNTKIMTNIKTKTDSHLQYER